MAEWRPDRRQVLRALLLAAAGLAVPSACGVPSGGGPIVDGPGPSYNPSTGANSLPPVPGDANSATELVQLFLDAISGPLNTPDAVVTARSRAKQFLTGQALNTWKPPDAITVVRLGTLTSSISGSATIVSGLLQTVGTFRGDRGQVDPAPVSAPAPVKFTVSQGSANSGMLISDLPPALQSVLPLGTDALDRYFNPQLIYFWDNRQRYLVPDLRYVPITGLTENGRLTAIVRWLLTNPGPSDLLTSVAAQIFPSGTDLSVATLTNQGGQLVVPFSSELQGLKGDLGKVLAQLRWSLQPLYKLDAPLELQIGAQPQHPNVIETSQYLSVNPADEVPGNGRAADPQPFCIAGGAVTALDGTLPAIVAKPEYNHDVLKAALSRGKNSAALLSTGKRLTIGRIDNTGTITYRPVELSGEIWSRPSWLLSTRLLVAVDGGLMAVSSTGVVSPPVLAGVTAFAVSPDGYRIALIVNGSLAVAALRDDPDQLIISNQRTLDSGLTDLTDVAWSRLERIVVAGKAGPNQWRLAEVSIDGALQTVWNTSFANPIVSVVGYPRLASDTPGPGQIMVQTQDRAVFRVFIGTALATTQQLGVKPSPDPSPSGSGNAPRVQLTAPFYPD